MLGDAFANDEFYDVATIMDVVEHVEDCFAFLRQAREKARYKVYHIPLEITSTTALRDILGGAATRSGTFTTFAHRALWPRCATQATASSTGSILPSDSSAPSRRVPAG